MRKKNDQASVAIWQIAWCATLILNCLLMFWKESPGPRWKAFGTLLYHVPSILISDPFHICVTSISHSWNLCGYPKIEWTLGHSCCFNSEELILKNNSEEFWSIPYLKKKEMRNLVILSKITHLEQTDFFHVLTFSQVNLEPQASF